MNGGKMPMNGGKMPMNGGNNSTSPSTLCTDSYLQNVVNFLSVQCLLFYL